MFIFILLSYIYIHIFFIFLLWNSSRRFLECDSEGKGSDWCTITLTDVLAPAPTEVRIICHVFGILYLHYYYKMIK